MPNDLDALLALDGASFEAAEGYVVEFKAKVVEPSARRPQGLVYSPAVALGLVAGVGAALCAHWGVHRVQFFRRGGSAHDCLPLGLDLGAGENYK